jgi:biotin carboxylase
LSERHDPVRRVLIAATTTGYQIRSFGDAARAVGVRLIFASDRCDQLDDPWWDQAIPVRFTDAEGAAGIVASALQGESIDGVVAVGDRPVLLTSLVAERCGVRGHPPAAASASGNKLLAREAFRRAGLPTPAFRDITADTNVAVLARNVSYPAVVKPLTLSGSRGVIRANSPAELSAAIDRIRAMLRSPDERAESEASRDRLLVEAFIPGREFAVEGLLTEGRFHLLAIFDKPDPLDGPFFEETIYVTPSREPDSVQQEIVAAIGKATTALGLRHGPVHAECRRNAGGVFVLEVAARPIGGLCSRVLRFQSPSSPSAVSLEELILRHAVGEDVGSYTREARAAAVMMIPIPGRGVLRGIEGVEEARAVPGVEDVVISAKPDTLLVPLPEGRSYLGFIFARATTPAAAEQAVRDAHHKLTVVVQRELKVVNV